MLVYAHMHIDRCPLLSITASTDTDGAWVQTRGTEFVEQRPQALSRVLALPPEISEHDRYWVATASASPVSLC